MHTLAGSCLLVVALLAQVTYLNAHRQPSTAARPATASVRWFGVAYPLVMLVLFVVGLDLVLLAGRGTAAHELPPALRWLGIGGMLGGSALFVWARRSLGANYSPCFASRQPLAVVAQGAYRWFRHPMYVGNLTTIGGAALAAGSWWLVLAWTVVAIAYWRAARDENAVLARVARAMGVPHGA
jgi:protein-S-isoprenylcysteine O-methyltransferase Ste14